MPRTGWWRKLLGDRGERVAIQYLRRAGFRIVARQSRNRIGEIDIIAFDGDCLVFVEVKTRQGTGAGHPADAVTLEKQRQLTRAALAWLKSRRWLDRPCRFDVVAILWQAGAEPLVTHFRHAFEAVGPASLY